MGLECSVYMGELDIQRQRPNVERMKMLGAKVIPATSGSKTLNDAVNEALEAWMKDPENFYLIGSAVGPQPYPEMVARFQSVISEEIKSSSKRRPVKKILITSSLVWAAEAMRQALSTTLSTSRQFISLQPKQQARALTAEKLPPL